MSSAGELMKRENAEFRCSWLESQGVLIDVWSPVPCQF
jgi:hypothetical protein